MYKTLRFMLVSLLMMLCGTVFAEEVTINASDISGAATEAVTVQGFTFEAAKNNGSTAPAYNANGQDFRLYAKGTLTVSSSHSITKMVFNISTQGKKRLAPITASTGTIADQASGDQTVTWTGNAKEVVLTVGDKANYGSDGDTKAGQLDFSSVTITYTPGTSGPVVTTYTATFTTNAGWNEVYAYAWSGDGETVTKFLGDWPGTKMEVSPTAANLYTLSFEAAETPAKIIFNNGQSGNGNQTKDLTFVNNKEYAYTTYASFSDLQSNATSTSAEIAFQFNGQQVVFVNGNNAYLADDQGFGVLVYTKDHGLVAGEKLYGIANCNLVLYQGSAEITGFSKEELQTGTSDVVPVEKTIGAIENKNQSTLVSLKGVYYDAENSKFYEGTDSIKFYDKFKTNVELDGSKKYNMTGIVIKFNNELEICPRTADDVAEATEPVVDTNYYILGDFWGENFEDAPQVMTQSPTAADIYTLVSKVTVEGKKYEYKLRQGDNWNGYQLPAQGNQDFVFGTEEYPAGTYTLTFTANITENKLELSVERDALEKAKAEFAALIADIEGKYNEFKDQMPAESQQEAEAAIQAAKDAVNDPNATLESLAAAKETFMAAALKAQSDALGLNENVTDKFDIEYNWISEMGAVTDYKNGNENLKEVWLDTTTDTGKVIHKTVEKLENGTYEVKLIGGALFTGNGETAALQADEEGRVMIYANNVALSIPVKFAQEGNTEHYQLDNVVVSDGKMEIGMEKLAPGSNRHFIQIEKVKMLSNTRQVADEEGQNNHWKGIAQTILGYEAYNIVTGEPREALAAAETKEAVMAAIPVFYASVPEVVEPTAIYSVAGEPSELFGAYWNEKATETEMTLNNEGLYEWRKENVTLAGGVSVQFKVVKNHDWSVSYPANNYVSEIQEDGVYNVVITFNDKTQDINAEIVKVGDAVIEPATITQVELRGDFNNWIQSDKDVPFILTKGETENVWTGTLDLTEMTYDPKFKLVVNENGWIGNQEMQIDAPDGWVDSAYDKDNNLKILHSITGYNTYTVTATWEPNANANSGWTLKFEGKDQKNPVVLNTYTASFTTNAGWGEVYAYAWTSEDGNTTEFLGAWPGTKLEDNEGVYTATIEAEAVPAYIIFNNGGLGAQTADLEFEDGKAYEFKISDEWAAAINAAAAIAEEDGVAVGKLIEAIAKAQGQTGTDEEKAALQAAVDQYKADNAPQETDLTSQFSALTDWQKWTGATGYTATNYCPTVDINDGTKKQVCEKYETTCATTGDIFYQTVTGLTTGTYKIELYGGAAFTFGRGFGSMAFTGEIGTGDAWGTHNSDTYTAGQHIDTETGVKMYAITSEGTYEEEIPIYYATNFPDGAATVVLDGVKVGVNGEVKIGMNKTSQSTNWHVVQLKGVTAQVLAKDLYAAHQTELQALVAEAQALAADENKTEGKEAFQEALTTAELAVNSQWYNNAEIEGIINNLKNAIANFKKANYFIDFAAGEYYVIDAESGKMMAAGSSYGTRGIVNETGLDLTLTPYTESRTVTFDSRVANNENDHFLGINLYMDSSSWGWALEYQGFGFYIKDPDGGKYINLDENDNLVLSDTPREFIIVTKDGVMEERMEELADATETNPVDATFLLQNPNFNRNDQRVSAWEWIPSETPEENADNWNNHNFNGGNQVNNCAESYHAAFVVKQTVSGAPAGKYTMTAQGFYRQDTFDGDAPAAPMFFANGVNKDVPAKTGEENSMSMASESFTSGLYTIEPVEFEVADDGMIYVGVTAAVHNQWVIFDNFQLKYYGKKDITDGISTIETEALKGNVYNLQGQKVTKAQKGLYIVNGRKMIQK